MWKQLRNRKSEDEGFTLIELLIVIIILGILAAIVVFAIGNTRKDAVASSCKTDAKSIQLSLEAQKTKTGKYPIEAAVAPGVVAPATALSPSAGALLRTWPGAAVVTGDYRFRYRSAAGADYTVTIDGASVDGGSFTDAVDFAGACDDT
jgi:prepilin-type N-terminal cleavage/methylation domain-containing protein